MTHVRESLNLSVKLLEMPLTRTLLAASAGFLAAVAALAQQPGPALSIDATANRHAISPDIYGISYYWDLGNNNDPQRTAHTAAAAEVRAIGRAAHGLTVVELERKNTTKPWSYVKGAPLNRRYAASGRRTKSIHARTWHPA